MPTDSIVKEFLADIEDEKSLRLLEAIVGIESDDAKIEEMIQAATELTREVANAPENS